MTHALSWLRRRERLPRCGGLAAWRRGQMARPARSSHSGSAGGSLTLLNAGGAVTAARFSLRRCRRLPRPGGPTTRQRSSCERRRNRRGPLAPAERRWQGRSDRRALLAPAARAAPSLQRPSDGKRRRDLRASVAPAAWQPHSKKRQLAANRGFRLHSSLLRPSLACRVLEGKLLRLSFPISVK